VVAASAGAGVTMTTTSHSITPTERQALVCMHFAVAAVLVPAFALAIPRRRPAEDAPGVRDGAVLPASHASLSRAGSCLTGRPAGQNPDEASAGAGGQPWTTTAVAC